MNPDADTSDLDAALASLNPWHRTGRFPSDRVPSGRRQLARRLWRRVESDRPRRFHLVLGARRVGKTTAMLQTAQQLLERGAPPQSVWWVQCDHPVIRRVRLDRLVRRVIDRADATVESPVVLFLDEVVFAEEWELWLKTIYDEGLPVRIVAGASASAELVRKLPEAGVGRFEEQYMGPLLLTESLDLFGAAPEIEVERTLASTLERLADCTLDTAGLFDEREALTWQSGFPEIVQMRRRFGLEGAELATFARDRIVNQILLLTLNRDIVQAFGVDDGAVMERLIHVLAAQVGGVLSPTSIASDIDRLSPATFERYLDYLQRAFVVFTLPNYAPSEAKVQRRGRKLYFTDGAIAHALVRRSPETSGAMLENLVAQHLVTLARLDSQRLFYWREGRNVVDFVWNDPHGPLAIEVTGSMRHSRKGLHAIVDRDRRFEGRAWLVAADATPMPPAESSDGVGTMPLDTFLVAVGRQAEAALARRLEL